MADVNSGNPPGSPPALGQMTPEQRAQWLYDNINSTISLPQWQAWADKVDPGCPQNRPFRTDKQVSGGNQTECVETPDNCPDGTRAFGANQCLPETDARFTDVNGPAAGTPGAPGAPGAAGAGSPQIGIQDLLSNMTFQRMFSGLDPNKVSQVQGGQNLFNMGNGQQAKTLEGGALQWGDAPGFSSTMRAPTPGLLRPTGVAGLITPMVAKKKVQPQTFMY